VREYVNGFAVQCANCEYCVDLFGVSDYLECHRRSPSRKGWPEVASDDACGEWKNRYEVPQEETRCSNADDHDDYELLDGDGVCCSICGRRVATVDRLSASYRRAAQEDPR
jgi:hypothetical protein